jgi:WD40 repeat protein
MPRVGSASHHRQYGLHSQVKSTPILSKNNPPSFFPSQNRLWDLAAGKTMTTLTHHKKSVRALAIHPTEYSFASASAGGIKKWKCPEGTFVFNFSGHNAIINTLSVNAEGVFFSGGKIITFRFYDFSEANLIDIQFQATTVPSHCGTTQLARPSNTSRTSPSPVLSRRKQACFARRSTRPGRG